MRAPVSVEQRVAVTVWKLATTVEYRTLSALFGLGRSTIGEIVTETCGAIAKHLLSRFIKVPNGSQLRDIVDGFESMWGFPQAAGAKPKESTADYYNRKGWFCHIYI